MPAGIMTWEQVMLRMPPGIPKGVAQIIAESDYGFYSRVPIIGYEGAAYAQKREKNRMSEPTVVERAGLWTPLGNSEEEVLYTKAEEIPGSWEIALQDIDISEETILDHSASAGVVMAGRLKSYTVIGTGVAGVSTRSLHSLCEQYVTMPALGREINFEDLDALISLVRSKGTGYGNCDFLIMNLKTLLAFRKLVRSVPALAPDYVQVEQRHFYNGIEIIVNDYLPSTETDMAEELTGGTFSSVFAGNYDTGMRKDGICLVMPKSRVASLGISFEDLGKSQTNTVHVYGIRALFNVACNTPLALARLTNIVTA